VVGRKGSVGEVYVSLGPSWPIDTVYFARPPTELDLKFFRHLLQYLRLGTLDRSTAVPGLSRDDYNRVLVGMPPAGEQRRIRSAIEEHLSRLDAAVAALERVRAALPRYRAAVLKAACEGRLVETDGSGDDIVLTDVLLSMRNGIATKPTEDSGQPILRISAVRPLQVHAEDVRYLVQDDDRWRQYFLKEGDLLFTRYNGNPDLAGVCGMVRPRAERLVYPDKLIRVRVDETRCLPGFAQIALNAGKGRAFIHSKVKTTAGQAGIAGSDLKQTPFRLPPVHAQGLIVAEVDRRLSLADAAERTVSAGLAKAKRLRQAILRRAFEGRLVPQDPSDEPASVLLEGIRTARMTTARKHA
jgi:type I restriction enzyme S subunit